MRRNVFLVATLRQPLRSILLMLLVCAVSFLSISRVVEYIVIREETERLSKYYCTIGMIEPYDPDEIDITGGRAIIAASESVLYEDCRRMNSAAMDTIYNEDISGFTSTTPERFAFFGRGKNPYPFSINVSDVFMYGELQNMQFIETREETGGYYVASLMIDTVITGYPEHVQENSICELVLRQEFWEGSETQFCDMIIGERYLVRACFNPYNKDGSTDLRMRPLYESGPLYIQVKSNANLDLGSPAYADLFSEIAIVSVNQHAMLVTSTKDMSTVPFVQESAKDYYLIDGRWINYDDNLNENRVCVVSNTFASLRGLTIGDRIKLTFRNIEFSIYGYIIDERDLQGWREYPIHEDEYEIIGLFNSLSDEEYRDLNSMYIPDACLPNEYIGLAGIYPSFGYSFVLKSNNYREAFISENEAALAEIGLSVSFLEDNYEIFWASVTQVRQTAYYNAITFAIIGAFVLLLSTFIYLRLRRKDFAITRAMGASSSRTVRKVLTPIAILGIIAVTVGGLLSWNYTLARASDSLTAVVGPEGIPITVTVPILWLVLLCAAMFIFLVLLSLIGALIKLSHPVMSLLQEIPERNKEKKPAST